MAWVPKRAYTLAFKQAAVQRAAAHGMAPTARLLGLAEQTLRNWIRAEREGRLARGDAVSPQRMEATRLRADNAKLGMRVLRLQQPGTRSADPSPRA